MQGNSRNFISYHKDVKKVEVVAKVRDYGNICNYEDVTVGWRKIQIEKLHNLCSSTNAVDRTCSTLNIDS